MMCNVGPREQVARVGLAVLMGAASARTEGRISRKLLRISAVAEMTTALTRFCPLNHLLGIDNCHAEAGVAERGLEAERRRATTVSIG